MRILFVLPRMVSGGVERVTLHLIAEFQRSGHECALALRRAFGEFLPEARALTSVYEVAPTGLYQFIPRLARLIRRWQPTHVVTAFADIGMLTLLAMRFAGTSARWVHGVHNTHAPVTARSGALGVTRYWLDSQFARFVYPRADAIVAVSEGVRDEIIRQFGMAPDRVHTIYNPVVPDSELQVVCKPRHGPAEPYTVAALGRLTRQKGFDILIEAMTQVPGNWHLEIWGEGEGRSRLQALIDRLGLHERIRLPGYTAEPYSILRRADLFVLSSRWEGFGMVLAEALACQCQVIAADCPQGPREILDGGRYGYLVPPERPDVLGIAIASVVGGHSSIEPWRMLERAKVFSCAQACVAWQSLLTTL